MRNLGLRDKSETLLINIAGNSYSSSFLNMLPRHVEAAPDSAYIGQQEISVTTLDSIFPEVASTARNIFMKIDTQGFERRVMQGALTSLPRIAMIQLEMSLVPLYEEELGLVDMLTYMSNLGYRLIALEPGFTDPRTAHLLQADGIFLRAEPTSATRQ